VEINMETKSLLCLLVLCMFAFSGAVTLKSLHKLPPRQVVQKNKVILSDEISSVSPINNEIEINKPLTQTKDEVNIDNFALTVVQVETAASVSVSSRSVIYPAELIEQNESPIVDEASANKLAGDHEVTSSQVPSTVETHSDASNNEASSNTNANTNMASAEAAVAAALDSANSAFGKANVQTFSDNAPAPPGEKLFITPEIPPPTDKETIAQLPSSKAVDKIAIKDFSILHDQKNKTDDKKVKKGDELSQLLKEASETLDKANKMGVKADPNHKTADDHKKKGC